MAVGGLDLGATNCRALIADGAGVELGRARQPTPQADGETIAETAIETLRVACSAADVFLGDLTAVGIGTIGPLDRDGGVVTDPPNVPAARIPLRDRIESVVDASLSFHNDAVAGVLGERVFGDAPENTVYLTLSSGVGAGAVVDGHVLSGHRGNAAEMGHVTLDRDGRPCGCGGTGHWEAYCGGDQLPAYAREIAAREDVDTSLPVGAADFGAADLFAAAGSDPLADRLIERVADWNTQGIATLVHAFSPELVSVGGAVALENPGLVLDPVRERLPDALAVPAPALRRTPHEADAVLWGAVASALDGDAGGRP